jgi:hypothetical protein
MKNQVDKLTCRIWDGESYNENINIECKRESRRFRMKILSSSVNESQGGSE